MSGSLVADLAIPPRAWLFLALVSCLTLFFKFSRFWSFRNLDLFLLFALGPAMNRLVGGNDPYPWWAFFWLFVGTTMWLVRCVLDLALTRRPLLEPNLNSSGMTCLAFGILTLLMIETVSLPVVEGSARNPADSASNRQAAPPPPGTEALDEPVREVLRDTPLPEVLKRSSLQVILSRVLAVMSHLGIVLGLFLVGGRHFDQPTAGLAAATCYLVLPYTRIALVDSGQILAAALIVLALVFVHRPTVAGLLIAGAACWLPSCLGLILLWAGYYRSGWPIARFLGVTLLVVGIVAGLVWHWPALGQWGHALGARSLAEAGLSPLLEVAPAANSFWVGIDPSFRLPVLIAYVAFVIVASLWPSKKDLGCLISQSAALLVASQYWFLDGGGTLILVYLPLVLLMMFRPTLPSRRRTAWLRPVFAPSKSSSTPLI